MRSSPFSHAVVALCLSPLCLSPLILSPLSCAAQAAPASIAAAPAGLPSMLLKPSLQSVQLTLSGLQFSRWKRGTVRDEAEQDMNAILQEIRVNLPPLLRDADAAPQSLSHSLPVVRHVGALYDVLIRVFDAARIAAPSGQIQELQLAMRSLERARLAFNDRLLADATAQELQISELRMKVQKQAAFQCPAPPPPKPCAKPKPRHVTRRRHTAKPAAGKKAEPATKPQTAPKTPQ